MLIRNINTITWIKEDAETLIMNKGEVVNDCDGISHSQKLTEGDCKRQLVPSCQCTAEGQVSGLFCYSCGRPNPCIDIHAPARARWCPWSQASSAVVLIALSHNHHADMPAPSDEDSSADLQTIHRLLHQSQELCSSVSTTYIHNQFVLNWGPIYKKS